MIFRDVSILKKWVRVALLVAFFSGLASAQQGHALRLQLERTYNAWRDSMINKDARLWSQMTATHRKMHVRNRILSEQRPFPSSVFVTPALPPKLAGLKALRVRSRGATATAVYFGKIDFGVGGSPTENVLLLSFVNESGFWRYDSADFISLGALADIKKQLRAGNLSYVDQKDFLPTGIVPPKPPAVNPAKTIAKVYAYCPGREVKVRINRLSDHRFQNTKISEVVIGGALDGMNEIQFATKRLEGSTGKEPFVLRVYLMSTVQGVKPIKAYEYKENTGEKVKPFDSGNFLVDRKVKLQLIGR